MDESSYLRDVAQLYIARQCDSDFKQGDHVRVLYVPTAEQAPGWRYIAQPGIERSAGKVGKILRISGVSGIFVEINEGCVNRTFWFPFTALEKVGVEQIPKFSVNQIVRVISISDVLGAKPEFVGTNGRVRAVLQNPGAETLYHARLVNGVTYVFTAKNLGLTDDKFLPFDKVLVRDRDDDVWVPDIFLHSGTAEYLYHCAHTCWQRCILFEGNEHLLGTTKTPEDQ